MGSVTQIPAPRTPSVTAPTEASASLFVILRVEATKDLLSIIVSLIIDHSSSFAALRMTIGQNRSLPRFHDKNTTITPTMHGRVVHLFRVRRRSDERARRR